MDDGYKYEYIEVTAETEPKDSPVGMCAFCITAGNGNVNEEWNTWSFDDYGGVIVETTRKCSAEIGVTVAWITKKPKS